ncbi:MAG TPA: hypothetical protein VHL57_00230 [Flavobacteriales bacterium]|jgi:hypothetical protein|nr:hypothetical protein [Flavobacteriales bacterium]
MERTRTLCLLTTAALFSWNAAVAQGGAAAPDGPQAIHQQLLRTPDEDVQVGNARYILVNDRQEPVRTRKQARKCTTYLKRIAPAQEGWSVRMIDAEGQLRMDGTSLDRDGAVLDGAFTFYDEVGRLRAEGRYDHGRKTGVWHRYGSYGEVLPDKTYYAEDWDALQVRVGLASMSADLTETTAAGTPAITEE